MALHGLLQTWKPLRDLALHYLRLSAVSLALLCTGSSALCQLSFTSAIDLSLKNSSRVKLAQDEVDKAAATLAETKSVFIPSIIAGSGAGASSGITLNVPTIFTINAQSLILNPSQRDYIRAARLSLQAANMTLTDVREQVEEDTASTYLSLDELRKRKAAMAEEYSFAVRLVTIVQERLDAGMESESDLKKALRTAVQVRLLQLHLDDQTASVGGQLERLVGLPGTSLELVPASIPRSPGLRASEAAIQEIQPDTPSILSAEANARAKERRAAGDSRYTWRPQITFAAQYGRISSFNGVSTYYNLKGDYNALAAGVQITLPFLDRTRSAKARESLADAQHAEHELAFLRVQQSEARLNQQHSIVELETKAELAELDEEIAQDQLNAMAIQLTADGGNSTATALTAKDQQNAHIQERQRYLDVLDAELQLHEAQISLLRQTGRLNEWLESLVSAETTGTR
jgi:outer membrane protein TolC